MATVQMICSLIQALALVAIALLLRSGRLVGPQGLPGLQGVPGKAKLPDVVQILRHGQPYHRAPFGSPDHQEALKGLNGLTVEDPASGA